MTKTVLSGSLSGQGVVKPISISKGTTTFTSSGSVIGPSTFDGGSAYSLNKGRTIKYTGGTAILADSSGDAIDASYSGSGKQTGGTSTFSMTGSVKGGAGKYAGAKGTVSAKGTFAPVTGAFSVSLKIVLKRL